MRLPEGVAVEWPAHGFDPCCNDCQPNGDCTGTAACCPYCEQLGGACVTACACGQPICTVQQPTVRDGHEQVHVDCYTAACEAAMRA